MYRVTQSQSLLTSFLRYETIALMAAVMLTACSQPPKIEHIEGYAEGTTYHISFWTQQPIPLERVRNDLNKTLAEIDKALSTYRADSYISQFNHSTSINWQPASADFIQLVEIAKDINRKTQGCYDPTIGPLFDLWGFNNNVLHVPSAAQIAAIKADLGMDKIQIDAAGKRIRKILPAIQLDLSSMGEGYTIGKLSEVLESKGITNYLLEFGGDMKIRGHKPKGKKWRIAIEKPVASKDGRKPYLIVTINNEPALTLDTSGTYQHYFDDNGKEYSHILDPRTGSPVTHDLVSASVFGTDPRVSDAWATALLCLGPKQGAQIAQQEKLEVLFIENKKGKLLNSKSEALANTKRVVFDKAQ